MENIVVQMGWLFSLNFADRFRDCIYLILLWIALIPDAYILYH